MNQVFSRRSYVAFIILVISATTFYAGYDDEYDDVYIFPIIVAGVMFIFSAVSLIRELFQLCLEDFEAFPFIKEIPVLIFMILGISLLEILGMFSTTFLLLLIVSYWYSAVESKNKRLMRSILFSSGFTLAMYLLFSVMLNVQLPRGMIF